MDRIKRNAKGMLFGWMLLAATLLLTANAAFLTDAAYFSLVPILGLAAILRFDPAFSLRACFQKERRTPFVLACAFSAVFLLQLSIFALLNSPLFSEAGLSAVWWPYRFLRLGFLLWNWTGYLLALLVSTPLVLFYAIDRSLSPTSDVKISSDQCPAPPVISASRFPRFFNPRADRSLLLVALAAALYLFSAYPSINGVDTQVVWDAVQNGRYNDWHPVTWRLFVRALTLVVNSRFMVTMFQSAVFVLTVAYGMGVLDGADPRARRVFALALILSAMPLFMLQHMTKDVLYSICLLGFSAAILAIVAVGGGKRRDWLLLFFYGFGVMSFRHAGILPIAAGCGALAFFALKTKTRVLKKAALVFCGILALDYLVVNVFAFGVLGAERNPGYVKYGTPMTLIASVAASGEPLEADEKRLMEEVMPVEKWAYCYNKYLADTVSRTFSTVGDDVLKVEEKGLGPQLLGLSLALMARYPKTVLTAFFDLNSIVWEIGTPSDAAVEVEIYYPLTDHARPLRDTSFSGLAAFTHRYAELVCETPVLRAIATRAGFAAFLLVLSAAVLCAKGRAYEIIAILPAAAVFCGLMISAPGQSAKLALPFIECAPFFAAYGFFVPDKALQTGKNPL